MVEIRLDTIGIEFTFDVKIRSPAGRVKFYRELYGWKNYSNFSKYTYIKDGVLSNMKYIKPTRSTVILSRENAHELRRFLKKFNVLFDEKIVILKKEEARKLGLAIHNIWEKIYEDIKGNDNTVLKVNF